MQLPALDATATAELVREDLLLRIAAQLEAAQPFVHRATRR